jgi:hypothetical protein
MTNRPAEWTLAEDDQLRAAAACRDLEASVSQRKGSPPPGLKSSGLSFHHGRGSDPQDV